MTRRILAVATLAVGLSVVAPDTAAQAMACQIDYRCSTRYYSDAAHTTQVGGLFEDCDGSRESWGIRTDYVTFTETPC